MKQTVSNVFSGGLNTDTNELTTPENVLTDCLNGTLITYNGKEFCLQNDFGNGIVESAKLKEGFIPIGLKEYGGIIYVVSHNPMTNESEFGSFPSPERNITPEDKGQAFESQGLGFVDITNNDFLSGGVVSVSSIKRDLMKPSDFELNPGDRFAIYFTNESNYNDLLTKLTQGTNRKYYKLRVAKVSETGVVMLSDFNVYKESDIAFDSDDVKYDVYKENSVGTLAIIMELETIDSFDFTINEKFISANPNNKIAIIKAYAKCQSLVKFKGFKLSIKEVVTGTIVYNKYLYLNKNTDTYNSATMEFELSGFEPEKEYSFEATPFSQFNMYDTGDLKSFVKIKNFVFGRQYSTGNDKYESSLFKYYVNDSSVKINFNFNVSTAGVIDSCYAEFYDPWSNVSLIYPVNDYINGIDSSITLPLVDNSLSQTLSGSEVCGITMSNLQTFAEYHGGDTTLMKYKPTLAVNSNVTQGDKLVLIPSQLRKTHGYIVKLSVIEKYKDENDVEITKYNDIYRYIYTNGVFNETYFDTRVKNMSLSTYNDISVKYELGESVKSESTIQLAPQYSGNHSTVNNIKYPYNIVLQSEATPADVKTYKTVLGSQKEVGFNLKYNLVKDSISSLFGITNYSAIGSISMVNGATSIIETPSYVGNESLSVNIPTGSAVSIVNPTTVVDADNNIASAFTVRCSTNRSFFGNATYNLANVRTLNTYTWVSLYDKLHQTAKDDKILLEFGIIRIYRNSTSNDYVIGIKPTGYTPEQTTQKIYNDNRDREAIITNPNTTNTIRAGGGPDGDRIKNFVTDYATNSSGFIAKYVGNNYYAADTSLGDRVPENEYILMLRHFTSPVTVGPITSYGYEEYGICPTPFLPEKNQFLYANLISQIKEICGNIVNVTKGNVTYIIFAPESNQLCYNGQFQSLFRVSGQKINYTVQNTACSKIVFLSSGSTTPVDYTTSLVKTFVNDRAAAAEASSTSTVIFGCHEKDGSNYFTGISESLAPKFKGETNSIQINIDDITMVPEVNVSEQNLYQQAKEYALQDQTLVERTTFPDTGKLISEGIVSKKDAYNRYAELFEYRDGFFNYKGNSASGYTMDGTGDKTDRSCPDLLIDFAK